MADILAAARAKNTGSNVETETEAIATLREDDNQVYEAFTLLKGINVYQSLGETPLSDVSADSDESSSDEE